MFLESGSAVFGIGLAGGIANELLHWWGLRHDHNLPHYASRPFYWIVTVAMIVLGGGFSWLQLGDRADALIAFQIGLVAPMFLQKLAKIAPTPHGAMGHKASLRHFLEG